MKAKVFVGGLNYNTTEESLNQLFAQFGSILSLRIVRNHETGRSRGFAFIIFDSEESAKASLSLDNSRFEGRVIGVKEAVEKR